MMRLVVRRLLLAIPLLLVVSVLSFVLTSLAPGNAAETILGSSATPASVTALERQLGLTQPLWEQYWNWLSHAITGNLGTSLTTSEAVGSTVSARLPVTLALVIVGTLASAILGVALGTVSALREGVVGRVIDGLAMLGFSIPNFWLGLVLVDLLAVKLHWFPATGYVDLSQSPSGWARSLVLPVAALAAVGLTGIAKQTRDSLREVMGREFIMALRADGMPERRIVLRHGLRNAAIPVVTLVGVFFVGMLGGTVLVESVFVLPGLGSLAVSSAQSGDLTTLQGIVVVFCVIVVLVNLLIDLAYGWLNPKARLS
ncbi:ABC transporter permease [Streptomyces maremycinicus]|uniref:ABC transporter permease n=1 Tax=Streptomyces maremycinicus TaxID=1679753 RepID=UPI0007878AA9|nr:ABC transporter permease [Streptomyces sp. NBRC 110468]